MTLRERIAAANRLQKTRMFKIIASVVVLVLGVALGTSYAVSRAAQALPEVEINDDAVKGITLENAKTPEEREIAEQVAQSRSAAEQAASALNRIRAGRSDTVGVVVGLSIASGLLMSVIWMGLGLTALGFVAALTLLALPPWLLGNMFGWRSLQSFSLFAAGVGILGFAFVTLMELLRAALSSSNAVSSIARNVVSEAVRMKVSLVFIMMLLLILAALPGLLDDSTPLRYRVQSFMQYGSGGSFWIIAVLVLFLAVGSVTFEQRDKIIWQTMTKPVAAWQYLLGKWVGVAGIAAVLLGVSSAGIFLFTEYLRDQKAQGEVAPFVAEGDNPISADRDILENQVLTARLSVGPELPRLTDESMKAEVEKFIQDKRRLEPMFQPTDEDIRQVVQTIEGERRTQFLTIEPALRRAMQFKGLAEARKLGLGITFRYRVSIGADDPRQVHHVTFLFPNVPPIVQQVPLGQSMTLEVDPISISSDGVLDVEIINGDVLRQIPGRQTMSFPPDGIEVFYPVGSYRTNFVRAMLVMWMKIAFLAMIGVCAGTFLSFPVASLVSFGVFFCAESTGFLIKSLDSFNSEQPDGSTNYFNLVVRAIAVPVARTFKSYSEMNPTANIVDGKLLDFGQVIIALLVLGSVTLALYTLGVLIFRKRELATYSGQ